MNIRLVPLWVHGRAPEHVTFNGTHPAVEYMTLKNSVHVRT